MNLSAVFLTGLLTGGLSCMAVQGGLLTATLAQYRQERRSLVPILSFLLAKLAAYTLLGFALGYLGSFFQLSITTQIILNIAISVFMIGTALDILKVHPVFRYFVLQPPRFLLRIVREQTRNKQSLSSVGQVFAPALVGFATIFIPCGTTQAMMALALGTDNPFNSALILFLFTLGTAPLFFILGFTTTYLNSVYEKVFIKVTALVIIVFAVFTINNAISLSGSRYTLSYFLNDFSCTVLSICPQTGLTQTASRPVKEATIYFNPNGYTPASITFPRNSQVKLNLVNQKAGGCIQAFTIPKLNIQKIVRTGTSETLLINTPAAPQDIRFTCNMGMFDGVIHII